MATTAPIYPKEMPCPLIEGTSAEISTAVVRTPFQSGNVKQRRLNRRMPHLFKLSWVLKQQNAYSYWLNWINLYGYNWFYIPLPSSEAGAQNLETVDHLIRLTSDLSIELINAHRGYFWRVTATAEWLPTSSYIGANGPAAQPLNWIVAGSVLLPSVDFYISNTPGTEPVDVVIAGTPASPSSFL